MIDLPRPKAWLMLLVLGITAYAPVIQLPFMWDDHIMIEDNAYLRSWSLENLKHDFTQTVSNGKGDEGYLRPVVTWSHRIDYSLWGLNPIGYHITSLLIHLANSLLLFELALVIGCTPIAAFVAASLFVVHPVGVEGLMIVTGRATFLSFFFTVGMLLAFSQPTRSRIALGYMCLIFALFSKEQSIVGPLLLGLLWWKNDRLKRYRLLLAASIALVLAYLLYRKYLFGQVGSPETNLPYVRYYVQYFPAILTHYVKLLLFPWNLHSHRLITGISLLWWFWPLFWAGVYLWILRKRDYFPLIAFCAAWFLTSLIPPSIAMVSGGFMLDHWGYWLLLSFTVPLGVTVDRLWHMPRTSRLRYLAAIYFPLLIGYALLTRLNIELRGTEEKMYRWALHFTNSNPIHFNLGVILLNSGRAKEAIPHFAIYNYYYPNDPNNRHALARAYWEAGYRPAAVKILKELAVSHPDFAPGQQSLRAAISALSKTKH